MKEEQSKEGDREEWITEWKGEGKWSYITFIYNDLVLIYIFWFIFFLGSGSPLVFVYETMILWLGRHWKFKGSRKNNVRKGKD